MLLLGKGVLDHKMKETLEREKLMLQKLGYTHLNFNCGFQSIIVYKYCCKTSKFISYTEQSTLNQHQWVNNHLSIIASREMNWKYINDLHSCIFTCASHKLKWGCLDAG